MNVRITHYGAFIILVIVKLKDTIRE